MKKQFVLILIISLLCLASCGQLGTSYEQISAIKTISERVYDLNKSKAEIKDIEDNDALSRDEGLYLEYDYPIREDEYYVIYYRFNDLGCFEIGLNTYLNKQNDAQKVANAIIQDLKVNPDFKAPKIEPDFYKWDGADNLVSIELDVQLVERGIIVVTIISNDINDMFSQTIKNVKKNTPKHLEY